MVAGPVTTPGGGLVSGAPSRQPAPPRHASEEHVQAVACAVLDELGLLWAHAPNEALQRGGLLYGALQVGQGVKCGLPDVLIFEPPPTRPDARGVAIELKTEVGSPSADQKRWLRELEARGWVCSVERGTDALLRRLRALGWDVDAAVARLASRGTRIEGGRLRVQTAAERRKGAGPRASETAKP